MFGSSLYFIKFINVFICLFLKIIQGNTWYSNFRAVEIGLGQVKPKIIYIRCMELILKTLEELLNINTRRLLLISELLTYSLVCPFIINMTISSPQIL